MRSIRRPLLCGVAVVATALLVNPAGDGRPVVTEPVARVLVVALPGLSWHDVDGPNLPNLAELTENAAVGDISTRIGRRRASSTDAYLSIGAGTRSVAPSVEVAVALDPDETYAGVATADILQRRLGSVPDGVAYLAAGAAIDLNERGTFGGDPGMLGDRLSEAGVGRAVIANADSAEGFVSDQRPPDGAYARGAATALMGSDGVVPSGTVGRSLLVDDPSAPFGRRLDHAAVLTSFDQVWDANRPGVVLVEASDLSRAAAYAPRASASQRRALRTAAMQSSDALLAALLERVDPARDAVLVISPVSRSSSPELAIVALRTPSVDAGLLRSATTRRDGYVQLADVAPTVLTLLGLPVPDSIEGRAFMVSPTDEADRVGALARASAAAGFRDSLMPVVVPLIIAGLALLVLAALQSRRLPDWGSRLIRPIALGALGVVPATFLAASLRTAPRTVGVYLLVVLAIASAIGAAAYVLDRRRPGIGPLLCVGLIVALFTFDVALGAPLQVNAVFGYSLAVAGRFAGLGNLAFALYGSSAILLAALMVERWGRRSIPWAVALLVTVLLMEGLPMLGADVGGVIAMVPAFGVATLVLLGRRVRPLDLLGLVSAAGVAVLGFALIDQTRPPGERTHLARLAEHLLDGRLSSFTDSLLRRVQASFGGVEVAIWLLIAALIAVVGLYATVAARPRPPWMRIPAKGPRSSAIDAAAAGLVVLAVLGLVSNDSSIAVPATMLIVVTPVAILWVWPGAGATSP